MDLSSLSILSGIHLPKWPKMHVRGLPITKRQAMEIIIRTDMFFGCHGGNDHKWDEKVQDLFGVQLHLDFGSNYTPEQYDSFRETKEAFLKKIEYIGGKLNYVHNTWLSSCYIFGPYGWCHPNGTINYVDNVGKWPSAEDLYSDWMVIAEKFPFLNIDVKVMSGEYSESKIKAAICFVIRDGNVEVVEPKDMRKKMTVFYKVEDVVDRGESSMEYAVKNLHDKSREHGVSTEWIHDAHFNFIKPRVENVLDK